MSGTPSFIGSRLLVAAILTTWAIVISLGVTAAFPQWLLGVATATGADPSIALRILTGLLVCIAGMIVVLGRQGRGLARLAAIGLLFNAIAQATHLWRRDADAAGGWWLVLATGLAGALLVACTTRRTPPPSGSRRVRPGLAGIGIAASLVIGAAIAANLELTVPRALIESTTYSGSRVVEDLATESWMNLPIEETELLAHLPQIKPLSDSQSTLIAFYRPECSSCHAFFDDELGEPPPARTIAIRVPAAEGVDVADTDLPEDVSCRSCIRLTLPEGPIWIVETPTVVLVEQGMVTCVATEDFERCLDRLRDESDAAAQPPSPAT